MLNKSYVMGDNSYFQSQFELRHEKTCHQDFRSGLTHQAVYLVKTKVLISCTVTAQLICTFVFAYATHVAS